MAKCPKCDKALTSFNEQWVFDRFSRRRTESIAYTCPHCDAVLGFGLDMDEIEKRVATVIAKARSPAGA